MWRHMRRVRTVGTHYGSTRIYGPTGHAIGGTAQQALRSLPTAATADDYATAGSEPTRQTRARDRDSEPRHALGIYYSD